MRRGAGERGERFGGSGLFFSGSMSAANEVVDFFPAGGWWAVAVAVWMVLVVDVWWVVVRRLGGWEWEFAFFGFLVFGSFGVGDGDGDGEVRCAPSPLTPSPPFFAGHRRIEALALLNNVFPRSQHKHRKHPQTPHHTAPHRTARAVDVDINFVECPASSSSLLLLRAPVVSPSGLFFFLV